MAKKTTEELNAQIAAAAVAKAQGETLGEATPEPNLPKEMPVDSSKPVVKVIMVQHSALYHPYQRRWVPEVMDDPVEMVLDNWLQCQIDAGLVKVVK